MCILGGLYGTISVLVRTVGGGEPWTSQIVPELTPTSNDTITQILGARDGSNAATAVRDYEILDTRVEFKVGHLVNYSMSTYKACFGDEDYILWQNGQ